jgi:hypothetical protein
VEKPDMNNQETLNNRLRSHRRRAVAASAAGKTSVLLTAELYLCSVLCITFGFFPWIALPLFLDLSLALFLLSVIYVVLHKTLIRPVRLIEIARKIELKNTSPHLWISLAVELASQNTQTSRDLTAEVIRLACRDLEKLPLNTFFRFDLKQLRKPFIAMCVFACALIFPKPGLFQYLALPLNMARPLSADIAPGSISVAQFSPCTLSCKLKHLPLPSSVITMFSEKNKQPSFRRLLRPDSSGTYQYIVDKTSNSFSYLFSFGSTVFGPETVTVVTPPKLTSLEIVLVSPAYTGRDTLVLPEGKGSLFAYEGTTAVLTAGSHYPLASARFIPEQGDTVLLTVHDSVASGSVRLSVATKYSFEMTDLLHQRGDSIPWFDIGIIPDFSPSVRLLKPGANACVSPALSETLVVEGIDDIGISDVSCMWQLSRDSQDSTSVWNLFSGKPFLKNVTLSAVWDLSLLSLYPGDTVFYWAVIRDNKPVNNGQIAVSDTFWFRVPGFEEIHESIAGRQSSAEQAMKSVRSLQETMKKNLRDIVSSSTNGKEPAWEEKKIIEDMEKSLDAQADSLKQALASLDEAVKQMREEGALSPELIRKMDVVRDAVKQMVEQYGDSLLFRKQDSSKPLEWNDIRKSIEKLKNTLPDLERQLETTLRFLEKLRRDQELGKLAAQAGNLAKRQLDQISEHKTSDTHESAELTEDINRFLDKLDSLSSPENKERLFDGDDLPSIDSIRQMNSNNAGLSAGEAAEKNRMARMSSALQSLSAELSGLLSDAMAAAAKKDTEVLADMARDALDLSNWQSRITSAEPTTEPSVTAATQQSLLDALKKSLKKLDRLSVVPPQTVRQILTSSQNALAAIFSSMGEQRNRNTESSSALAGLNGLAMSLMSAADMMAGQCSGNCGGGNGEGLSEGLGRLSQKQAAINSLTMQLLEQMLSGQGHNEGGDGEGNNSGTAAARAAQQQLSEELAKMAEAHEKQSGGSGTGKKLRELEEEARKLAGLLEKADPDVSLRQERFLVRLLQASLSMQKQNEGREERKSTTSRITFSDNNHPSSMDRGNSGKDTFYRIRSLALEGNFPEQYRGSVQTYLDSLGVLFLK